jgi:hypothetical protein
MSFRNSASYGKRQEYKAMAKLLELNFDVYATLVDDQGIDCIIRLVNGERYLDIQIKARSKNCELKNRGYFPLLPIIHPRDNYFFILYSEQIDTYWVIPSLDIVRMANEDRTNVSVNKQGSNTGKYAVRTAGANCNPLPQFERYKNDNGFALLK